MKLIHVRESLEAIERQQRAIEHRKKHIEGQIDDIFLTVAPGLAIRPGLAISPWISTSLSTPDDLVFGGRHGVIIINKRTHPDLAARLEKLTTEYKTVANRLKAVKAAYIDAKVNLNSQQTREAKAQVRGKPITASQIAPEQVPTRIQFDYIVKDVRGPKVSYTARQGTFVNPYFENTEGQYAGDPESYPWWEKDAVYYNRFKSMLAKHGLKFDVVYASNPNLTKRPNFIAVAQTKRGNIVWYRRNSTFASASYMQMPNMGGEGWYVADTAFSYLGKKLDELAKRLK